MGGAPHARAVARGVTQGTRRRLAKQSDKEHKQQQQKELKGLKNFNKKEKAA